MFRRFQNTVSRFMIGRYGMDNLNKFLLITYVILWLIGAFVRRSVAGTVIYLLSVAVLVIGVSRLLSRNFARRQAENERFLHVWRPVQPWFRLQADRIRYIGRYRFRRCPHCKATLRLPIRRGYRTVTCFRCHGQFKTFFL